MIVAYVGNFRPPHSTENHIARALETVGHEVVRLQEGFVDWSMIPGVDCDFVLWTTTYDYAGPATFDEQRAWLKATKVPVVGYHLDRWWGLEREHRVHKSPFFRWTTMLCTADGGHQDEFASLGIEHVWMPPAVSTAECEPGTPRAELASDVVFVGSWQGGYHAEWTHRPELVKWLQRNYGFGTRRCRFWPEKGRPALRGEQLRDLYASVKVCVGDSCLVDGATRYWSDRIPETLGRGGYLIHPDVVGLEEHFADGVHLDTWQVGNWEELQYRIDWALEHQEYRQKVASEGREWVLAEHTYEVRMRQLADVMRARGLL